MSADSQPNPLPPRLANWQLTLGITLVLIAGFLAIFGPSLAPRDPMQVNAIVRHPDTRQFVKPPFAAFAVPGFILGTDRMGRDILSQLLWAVRPTLQLVLMVAALRMILGIIIGLASGWVDHWSARVLNGLISAALALPGLFVALCLIAAVGIKFERLAFFLGLAVTGWAETARMIRELTRTIRIQPYIEAERALGLSGPQILIWHILPQIMPLVWMLLSFEISSTLMTVAGLGFLGYFVNAIWLPLGDFSAIRTSGHPELGQMLASAAGLAFSQPGMLMAVGSLVFIIVLGFNMLGEGLRLRLDRWETKKEKTRIALALDQAGYWLEERWLDPASGWKRVVQQAYTSGILLALIITGALVVLETRASVIPATAISIPGGHYWAAQQRDSQGTSWAAVQGPKKPGLLWSFKSEAGFSGGPVVSADGSLYIGTLDGHLYSLDQDGRLRWDARLPGPAFGTPALNSRGDVFVLDQLGTLAAFSANSDFLWAVRLEQDVTLLTSPVVDHRDVVYYLSESNIIAINSLGKLVWATRIPKYSYINPGLRLSADDQWLFFEDIIVDTRTGETLTKETLDPMDRFLVGADGNAYLGSQGMISAVQQSGNGIEYFPSLQWDYVTLNLVSRLPHDSGIAPDGRGWIYYAGTFEYGRLVWIFEDGQMQSAASYPWSGESASLLGFDRDGTAYVCAVGYQSPLKTSLLCRANQAGQAEWLWQVHIDPDGNVTRDDPGRERSASERSILPSGGALAPGRLYVATSSGKLYALGDLPAP